MASADADRIDAVNILFCNERFLFRFGVDRALLMLGRGLAARGHSVSFMGNRFDRAVVDAFAERSIVLPQGGASYLELSEFTAEWLRAHWDELFAGERKPDVAILGGWPFFDSIPLFEERGCPTIFMDCGAVPAESYTGATRAVQDKVASLRSRHLPQLSLIAPISRFIAGTQSEPQAGGVEVRPILLGADHIASSLWDTARLSADPTDSHEAAIADVLRGASPVILSLGRWEPGCYKNSEAVFDLIDRLERSVDDFRVGVLADEGEIEAPARYRSRVIALGHPDDDRLQRLMQSARLGVSLSRWEGFNLPLVEMQWLDKPVLAFDVAAHPEVVVDPYALCSDIDEMAAKAAEWLQATRAPLRESGDARDRFRDYFRWDRVVAEYEDAILRVVRRSAARHRRLLIDVSNAARDTANSGVIRVTRRLARELQAYCDPQFVVWDPGRCEYVWPTEQEYTFLSAYNGPVIAASTPRSADNARRPALTDERNTEAGWLLLSETVMEANGARIRRLAAARGLRIAAIFYDAIPVLRPDLVGDATIRENHAAYMTGLGECDLVIPISRFSESCLKHFWSAHDIAAPRVEACLLPGEFGGAPRATVADDGPRAAAILCVSTLEPRKNHAALIEAFKRFAAQPRHREATLTLIGNRYAGGDDIAQYVSDECKRDPRIRWLGVVDDATLHRAYRDCTFTVYASEIEGFGIPILESIWHGKPCICHREGVMAELAADGGCMTVDVTDVASLAQGLGVLAEEATTYARLVGEALARPVKTWREYAMGVLDRIGDASAASGTSSAAAPAVSVEQLLYPNCLTKDWQMHESERLGMMAVLHRLKPTCAIEVGTYKGGSLSLLSQYAKAVFSIDIDAAIPERLAHLRNVSFLTGPSAQILPALLRELDAAGLPVEFVLIDGDHSTEGVRRDIEILLDYVPRKPLLIMLHDGFNPECRLGMELARWSRSPFVQWVDLDFIPGRVVEHGGGGDGGMWGGLAMALMTPDRRSGPLQITESSKRIFAELKERHHA